MHPNVQLINRFYTAFQNSDPNTMGACYADDVEFCDEVFTNLRGERARAMWEMLCTRGSDLRVEYRDVEADDTTGRAHWDAWYTFSATGRKVHNSIDARFVFADGLITSHVDHFSFWAWARQALGPVGQLLGWTPVLRKKVQAQAARNLDEFIASKSAS